MQNSFDQKINAFDQHSKLLFKLVSNQQANGINLTEIRKKTNMSAKHLNSLLNNLYEHGIIQKFKKNNKNYWLRSDIECCSQLSGGSWFVNNQLNVNLIKKLQDLVEKYLVDCPKLKKQLIKQIGKKQGLKVQQMQQLIESMCLSGRIENRGSILFILKRKQKDDWSVPCLKCPVFNLCKSGCKISPESCPYLQQFF